MFPEELRFLGNYIPGHAQGTGRPQDMEQRGTVREQEFSTREIS